MRFAVAAVVLVAMAATPARACPERSTYAFAVVGDGDTPGLAAAIDRLALGSWPGNAVGLVVTGDTIGEPLGPLTTITGDALRPGAASGDAEYAAELAMLTADHAGYPMHAMYVIGKLSPQARERLHARAAARGVHVVEYDTADEVGRPRACRPASVSRVVRPSAPAPDSPSPWPALLLLVAASAIARRTFRA